MSRIKRGVTARRRHKRLLKQTKGFQGLRSRTVKKAREALFKAWTYAYRDRRTRKRDFRQLWIQRINAGARQHNLSYSQLMHGLKLAGNELDRKILADIAYRQPEVFKSLAEEAKKALAKGPARPQTESKTKESAKA